VTARRSTTVAGARLIVAHAPRERTRNLVRSSIARRVGHVAITRTVPALERRLRASLVDVVVVDLGATGDVLHAAALAREFPSVGFVAVTPFRSIDAPAIAECAAHDVAEVLADGIDDGLLRHAVEANGFSWRFAAALDEPPRSLGLSSDIQRRTWRYIVDRAGRVVRTHEPALDLGMTREHLSRTFAFGAAATLKRVIDLVRVLAAAELAKNPGYDLRDVVRVLGFGSVSQLSAVVERLVGRPATSLSRLRAADLVDRFVRAEPHPLVSSATL
jgi:AraC-like DNA-binding protein